MAGPVHHVSGNPTPSTSFHGQRSRQSVKIGDMSLGQKLTLRISVELIDDEQSIRILKLEQPQYGRGHKLINRTVGENSGSTYSLCRDRFQYAKTAGPRIKL